MGDDRAMDMQSEPQSCTKCGGVMVRGFVFDQTHGGGLVSRWMSGVPRKSFWTGVQRPAEAPIPIAAFRCAACGYLESYARESFAAE
jgi:hypothetical protein